MSFRHAQSLFDDDHSSFSVLRALLVGEIQLSQTPEEKKMEEGLNLEIEKPRKWTPHRGQTIALPTANSRMPSPRYG